MFRLEAAIAALVLAAATPAVAGVFVDITYTGTATGFDRNLFSATATNYVDNPFAVTFTFYEDEGPEQDYSLGAIFTMNGIDYAVAGSASSRDALISDSARTRSIIASSERRRATGCW